MPPDRQTRVVFAVGLSVWIVNAMILLLAFYPEAFLPVMAIAYALSGPVLWLLSRLGGGRSTLPPNPPALPEGQA